MQSLTVLPVRFKLVLLLIIPSELVLVRSLQAGRSRQNRYLPEDAERLAHVKGRRIHWATSVGSARAEELWIQIFNLIST